MVLFKNITAKELQSTQARLSQDVISCSDYDLTGILVKSTLSNESKANIINTISEFTYVEKTAYLSFIRRTFTESYLKKINVWLMSTRLRTSKNLTNSDVTHNTLDMITALKEALNDSSKKLTNAQIIEMAMIDLTGKYIGKKEIALKNVMHLPYEQRDAIKLYLWLSIDKNVKHKTAISITVNKKGITYKELYDVIKISGYINPEE